MERLNFNQIVTVLTNISVVVGIVFLAFEIRQNTNMMFSQTRDSLAERRMSWRSWVAGDLENIEIWERGNDGELDPDSIEEAQYRFFVAESLH